MNESEGPVPGLSRQRRRALMIGVDVPRPITTWRNRLSAKRGTRRFAYGVPFCMPNRLNPGWRIPDSPSLPIRERVSRITSPHRRGPRAAASQNQIQKRIHVSVCQTRGFCVPVPNPEHVGPHGDAVSVSRGTDQRDWRAVIDTGLRISVGHLCGIMRITAVRCCRFAHRASFEKRTCIFGLDPKMHKKDHAWEETTWQFPVFR